MVDARLLFEPGRDPYHAGEAIWTACNANAGAFLAALPAERSCVVRYEELVAGPDASLRAICDLLEREFQPAMADPYARPGAIARGAGDLLVHLRLSLARENLAHVSGARNTFSPRPASGPGRGVALMGRVGIRIKS